MFESRRDDALTTHNGLIVLDFDHIDVDGSKSILATDDYIKACWISPSGDGLKALIKISTPLKHREHFKAIQLYMERTYGLEVDPSGKNESRACFESYDEDIIINEHSKTFSSLVSKTEEKQKAEHKQITTDYNKLAVISSIVRRATDGEKHTQLIKAAHLAGGFVSAGRIEEDEARRVLLREILKKDIDSEENAKNAISDAIEAGKRMPIRDVVDGESRAIREMQLNDNDFSFVSNDDLDFSWITDYASGNIEIGLETGNEVLDKNFRYKKDFTIINGISNVGKTTLALYLMVNSAVKHNWKWIVYSSENKTASVKMRLMEFIVDMPIKQMDPEMQKYAFNWVNKHFKVISNNEVYNYSELLLFAEKIVHQEGNYDGLFIDPYNSLRIDMAQGKNINSHEYHYEAASEFLTFSNRMNMAVWLNMHAITEAQRMKGLDGLPLAPSAAMTEGGGKFVNRADCFLTFHRKVASPEYETRKTMEFHVRKIRETETGGECTVWDQPFMFRMNESNTGFSTYTPQGVLYKPLMLKRIQGELVL
tara:strand:- start:1699 stop:3312 length:1614 start_codon:yes stop_codon:yes gene_type:complete